MRLKAISQDCCFLATSCERGGVEQSRLALVFSDIIAQSIDSIQMCSLMGRSPPANIDLAREFSEV
jgi:hypothetical protein